MGKCMCEGGEQTLNDAFNQVTARIMSTKTGNSRPYGEYIAAKKKAPGYIAKDANLLKQKEFTDEFMKNREKSIQATYDKLRGDSAKKRDAAIAAAKKLPADQQAAAIAKAEKDYAFEMEWHDRNQKLAVSTERSTAYLKGGFVDDKGQLFVNLDGPSVPRVVHHETLHRLASPEWDRKIDVAQGGHNLDEAVTEHFTRKMGYTTDRDAEPIYRNGPDVIAKRYSDDALARAYFSGDLSKMEKEYPIKKINAELAEAAKSSGSTSVVSPLGGR
jgi:hypothetical protein